jgi:hypothetical protein
MTTETTVEEIKRGLTEDAKRWPTGVDRFRTVGGISVYPSEVPDGEAVIDPETGRVTIPNGASPNRRPLKNWSDVRRWAVEALTFALPRLRSNQPAIRAVATEWAAAVLTDLPLWASRFGVAVDLPSEVEPVRLAGLIELLSRPSNAPEHVTVPDVVKWLNGWKYDGSKGRTLVAKQSATWGDPVETKVVQGGGLQPQWLYSRAYPVLCRQFPGAPFPQP